MIEREAKLLAGPSFSLPELSGVREGVVAVPLEPRSLRTVHHDTPDLRLLSWGATLRYRTGEGWTVKLPRTTVGALLERDEVSFAGGPRQVPAGAEDLLQAYLRGRRPVAGVRYRTTRRPLALRDAAGRPLAEVVDDEVVALHGRRVVSRFREIEVELTDDAKPDLLEAVLAALVEAGARTGEPIPKLLRVLGVESRPDPELVPPTITRDATVGEVVHSAIVSSVTRLLTHDAGVRLGNEEDLHQERVATRRLRSDLRTFSALLDPTWVESLRGPLSGFADALGRLRDFDVLAKRLARRAARLPAPDQEGAARLLARLGAERRDAREELLGRMRSPEHVRFLEDLVAAAREPVLLPAALEPAAARLPELLERPWARLQREVAAVPAFGPADALHRVRVRAKRCRYAVEAAEKALPRKAARLSRALGKLQDTLGEHQDAVVADAWLRRAARSRRREEAFAAGELVAREHRAAARARRSWRRDWRRVESRAGKWLAGEI